MEGITFASLVAGFVSVVTAVFSTIVSTLKASYDASHKWFAIGCGIVAVLLYFGYVHLTVPAHDDALAAQVALLSKKIDALAAAKVAMPAGAAFVDPKSKVAKK